MGALKRMDAAAVAAVLAHILAWVAFLWLALWPAFYQGASVTSTEVPLGGVSVAGGEERRFSASLVQVNGRGIIPLLLVPVLLTVPGLAMITARTLGA